MVQFLYNANALPIMQACKEPKMLINEIVSSCDKRYLNKECSNCSYGENCPNRCDKCLHYIHSPSEAPAPRKYDCPNMADFYVCKYSYKYTSEMIYALRQLRDIKGRKSLKVLSIGCGPCTELFALDYLKETGKYKYEEIEFRGIDPLRDVWGNIHKEIKRYNNDVYANKFFNKNIIELIDTIIEVRWLPQLVVFQYVFSDMQKNTSRTEINRFIDKLSEFINNMMEYDTYIVLNDINLSTRWGGGREYFDAILSKVHNCSYFRYHFSNSNKPNHFHYGEEYDDNSLIINIPRDIRQYDPYNSCASAQLLIKKVRP